MTHSFDAAFIRAKAEEFKSSSLTDILAWTWETFGERAAIGTSFQGAGLVVMHTAYRAGFRFPVFTIDTGLLFPETLRLKQEIESLLDVRIESLLPDQSVQQQGREFGEELWKSKPDLCCTLRKVEPLQKKLATLDVWITGLRREQGETREGIGIVELYPFDRLRDRSIIKLNPMASWSRDQVQAYIATNALPTNPLAALGYRSIGCQPCTRPAGANDDERAGRWTGFDKAECGIHTFLGEKL